MKNVNFLKRFLFALLLLCPNTIWAYDLEVDGIYYNLTSATDLTVEVAGRIANESTNDLIIPSVVNYNSKTLKVTGIGYNAFPMTRILRVLLYPIALHTFVAMPFMNVETLKLY